MKLPEYIYHNIYSVLVQYVGAKPWHRDDFVDYFTNHDGVEYRCCDALGLGGKFLNSNDSIYIGCNKEDETAELHLLIDKVNCLLRHILDAYLLNMPK